MAPSPPSFKTVVVEVDRDAGVGTLRLNRPRKSNAIGYQFSLPYSLKLLRGVDGLDIYPEKAF